MNLTYYDGAMVAVLVGGMIWGAFKGVTWQLASIASLVLGYTVSHQFSPQVAPYIKGDPVVSRTLAMLATYAVVSGGVFLVAWMFRAVLKKMRFEAFDRHLGMILGGLEGGLLGVVATFFVVSLVPSTRDPIFSSPSGKIVGNVMNAVGPVLPSEARDALAPFIAEAKQAIDTGEKVLPLVPAAAELNQTTSKQTNDGTVERR